MTKLTMQMSNWTNDLVEININEVKKTVRVQGNLLKIVTHKDRVSDHHVMELCEVYFEDMQLCTGYKDGDYWFLDAGDLTRDHSNLYVVAAQMACNLI